LLKTEENIHCEDAMDAKDVKTKGIFIKQVFLATFAPWRFNGFESGIRDGKMLS
jgi:hypothetical protein